MILIAYTIIQIVFFAFTVGDEYPPLLPSELIPVLGCLNYCTNLNWLRVIIGSLVLLATNFHIQLCGGLAYCGLFWYGSSNKASPFLFSKGQIIPPSKGRLHLVELYNFSEKTQKK